VKPQSSRQLPSATAWQRRWNALLGAPRVVMFGLFILIVYGVFTYKLWDIQFVEGQQYTAESEKQRMRAITVVASRGLVYDRGGEALVRNVPVFNVVIVPAYLPEDEAEEEAVLRRLADMVGMLYSSEGIKINDQPAPPGLHELLTDLPFSAYYYPLTVGRDVPRDMALLVAQESVTMPGVRVEVRRRRDYPYGALVSQLVGYLSPIPENAVEHYEDLGYDPAVDRVGMAGVEATYEDMLRGQKGRRIVEEDVTGHQMRVIEEQSVPVPGDNVFLTIDVELQRFVEQVLRKGMEAVDSPRGVAIVMNPQTGEILATVSLPTYDDNMFVKGLSMEDWQMLSENRHRPLLNHAISDALPPGSIFKIVVASGALQEGVITPDTEFECRGKMVVPNRYYPNDPGQDQAFYCWNRGGHGWLNVVEGIAQSCDIFFYKTGGGFQEDGFDGLGVAKIAEYAQLFGLGEPTGVELPAEVSGHVPTADWKRLTYGESWSTGDTYLLSIGQGYLLATPLQMLNAANVIANGGTLYRPQIVYRVTDSEGAVVRDFSPQIIRTLPISPENLSLVRLGMEGAITHGTAPKARIEGIAVAGKTGTAQYCDDIALDAGTCGVGLEQPTHAWFLAYGPADKPEVSVIVFIYNGGEGTVASVPVADDILRHYFGLDKSEDSGG